MNASRDQNKSYRRIVHEILEEAEDIDRVEDEEHGDQRGDELPREMQTEEGRRGAFRAATIATTPTFANPASRHSFSTPVNSSARSIPREDRFPLEYAYSSSATIIAGS